MRREVQGKENAQELQEEFYQISCENFLTVPKLRCKGKSVLRQNRGVL